MQIPEGCSRLVCLHRTRLTKAWLTKENWLWLSAGALDLQASSSRLTGPGAGEPSRCLCGADHGRGPCPLCACSFSIIQQPRFVFSPITFFLSGCGRPRWPWDGAVPGQGPQMHSMPLTSSEQAFPLPESAFWGQSLTTILNLNVVQLENVSRRRLLIHHQGSSRGPQAPSASAAADPLSWSNVALPPVLRTPPK